MVEKKILISEVKCPKCGEPKSENLAVSIGEGTIWCWVCLTCGKEWRMEDSELERG